MDNNRGLPHSLTASALDEMENIHISSSTESTDDKYYSDSEPESESPTTAPTQYMLPQRNHSSMNRTPMMDRMAASNKSVRMKRGMTVLDRMTTPLKSGVARYGTTTPLKSTPAQNTLPASSFYVPPQWMFPSSTSSSTVPPKYRSQPSTLPSGSTMPLWRPSAPPYSAPPPYTAPPYATPNRYPISISSIRSQSFMLSQYTRPNYMSRTSSMIYTSQTSLSSIRSQSFATPNPSKTSIYANRHHSTTPPYRYPCSSPPYISQSSVPIYTSQDTSQTSTYSKRSQSSASSYISQYLTPTYSSPSSMSIYTFSTSSLTYTSQTSTSSIRSQSSTTPSTSQIFTYSKRSQSSTPSHKPPYPLPTDIISSSVSKYTSRSSSLTQSSTPFHKPPYPLPTDIISSSVSNYTSRSSSLTQSSTRPYSLPYSTSSSSPQSSVAIYTSQPSSLTYAFSSSASKYNVTSSALIHMNPQSAHYTFPRSEHYLKPISGTHYSVKQQSSTQNPYPLSVYEPSHNVWPTEVGSVMQASMQNIWSVLATNVQNVLPPSTTIRLKSSLQPAITKRADVNPSPPPITPHANNHQPLYVDLEQSNSNATTSNPCVVNCNKQPEVELLPLFFEGINNKDALENFVEPELQKAWIYFSKMEVINIKPDGEIKCICPTIKFEDLLKASIDDKFLLVNMYRQYKANNLLFETKYDYNSLPQKTIVDENMKKGVIRWLSCKQMEEYGWFFKSLSSFEIQNINPTNIQKFITRTKSNKTISLEDQLKICCIVKKIKERPVSLLSISLLLQNNTIKRESVAQTIMAYMVDILQFPIFSQNRMSKNIMMNHISFITQTLLLKIFQFFKIDSNRVMEGLAAKTIETLKKNLRNKIRHRS